MFPGMPKKTGMLSHIYPDPSYVSEQVIYNSYFFVSIWKKIQRDSSLINLLKFEFSIHYVHVKKSVHISSETAKILDALSSS